MVVLHLARIGGDAFQPLRLKVVAKQQMLAIGGHLAPVENGDAWSLGAPAPLAVGVEQRVQHAASRRQRAQLVVAQERAHDGQPIEHLGEDIVVRARGGRLGVVFGDGERALLGEVEGVQPRGGAGRAKPRVEQGEFFFPVLEAELRPEDRIVDGRLVRLREGAEQGGAGLLQKSVVLGKHEAGAQHRAQRALAKLQSAALQLRIELPLGLRRQLVGQEVVIRLNRVLQGHSLPPRCPTRPPRGAGLEPQRRVISERSAYVGRPPAARSSVARSAGAADVAPGGWPCRPCG